MTRFSIIHGLGPIMALVWLALPTSSSAIPLTIFDSHELGFVDAGIPAGDGNRVAYVNHLIGMALGGTDTDMGQTFTRSANYFGSLPAAVFALNGSSTTIDLGTTGAYAYLLAKYDGPNYGSEVWFIGNLTGIITIPATGGGYGLSGWTLFTGSPQGVPDSGTTLMLLGASLAAVEFLRRTLLKRSPAA